MGDPAGMAEEESGPLQCAGGRNQDHFSVLEVGIRTTSVCWR